MTLRTPRLTLTPAVLKTLPTPNGPFWDKSCFPRPWWDRWYTLTQASLWLPINSSECYCAVGPLANRKASLDLSFFT